MSAMDAYLKQLGRCKLIDREEEHALAVRYLKTRDPALAHKLAEAHLRLVVKIAHEYGWSRQQTGDLIQAGNVGLLRAIEKYDPHRGVRLSSYSSWWIRAYIIKAIIDNWRLVRIGTTARQRHLLANLRRERERLEQEGDGADPATLAFVRHATRTELPLDAPAPGREVARIEELPATDGARPDLQVEKDEYLDVVRGVVSAFASELHGRDAIVFRERWVSDQPATLQRLGRRYGISRERIRQIESKILHRLRRRMAARLGMEDTGGLQHARAA